MGKELGQIGQVASFVADPFDLMGRRAGAQAAEDAANAQLGQQRGDRAAAMQFAEASPAELANLQRAIAFSEGDIARKTKLLESVDPALIEAGRQAKALMEGKEANVLAPLRQNMMRQETKLREKLASQLGAGYENTTAGIQALEAFNQQANSTLANAQQQSLGQLLGVAQNSRQMAGNLNNEISLGQLLGGIQNRKIGALSGTPVDPGLAFAGDMAKSGVFRQQIGDLAQIGGMVAGAMGGGMPGGGAGGGKIGQAGNMGGF
jgi:hypothetical protein